MITAICVALAVTFGSLLMYTSFLFGEMHGHEKGLDEAEQIAREVHDETVRGNDDRA